MAYFAKGPLSRARASVIQCFQSENNITELIEALRSNILSRTMTDTKYSDALPSLLRELPIGIGSDDEEDHVKSIIGERLRKSKKRKRVGKNGLFPGEEEYVVKWHFKVEEALSIGGHDASLEERIRLSLIEQRARETQLQITLALETLALEASRESRTPQDDLNPVSEKIDKSHGKARLKSKKSLDLPVLVDMLVERLCIWHSTSQEEAELVRDSGYENLNNTSEHKYRTSNNDQLKDFCTEVVIPL